MTDLFTLAEHKQQCPKCQQPLVIRAGKNGAFLGCSGYPSCDYIKALHQHETTTVKLLETEPCPECSAPLAVKNGRYGMFIGCSNYPECHFIVSQQAESAITEQKISCPKCSKGEITERLSKFGKVFYGCDSYPQCKFLVNDKPCAGKCVNCGFNLLVQRKAVFYCADKRCGQKQPAD
ncbi:type I DNA topoisomerase [Rheinheimera sp. MMS21-TC3]|uniref:DNA topoisomerase family protein n=1 Tax=Rheinheimera sp. MMS21-TC3 TaxID=3072790 RepID=UPI0028C41A9B|nr:topoisomerase DNA-binding C4 zinc finger domain-containing protein [Rheinheimera sp. MMS21-TC3]WNO59707.1 topoisomerase DNA-binding C4 zinc finger domain-containing protein [Rheinheimera sp. MMS21-TC3]